jgi:hypothetical protein
MNQQRGRSPSAGHKDRLSHSPSPSPHAYHDAASGLGLDPAVSPSTFTSGRFTANTHSLHQGADPTYNFSTPFIDSTTQSQHIPQTTISDSPFAQQQQFQLQENHFSPQEQSLHPKTEGDGQYSQYLNSNQQPFDDSFMYQQSMNQDPSFNPSLLLDPQLNPAASNQAGPSINPADLSRMSSPHQNHTPPTLLPPEAHTSPNQPSSPASTQGQFYTPSHSRHTSLDPSSAMFSQGGQQDWQGMMGPAFQGHRRAPSEHSDVSSSAVPSPYMAQQEAFESIEHNHSPLLNPQSDYHDALGMESFNLSEPQPQPQQHISPHHSPYISPMVRPVQGPVMGPETNFMLTQQVNNHFSQAPAPELYAGNAMGSMHQRNGSADYGQAAQMGAPPEINVQYAPSERTNSFEPGKPGVDADGLSPPVRSKYSLSRPPSTKTYRYRSTRSISIRWLPHPPTLSRRDFTERGTRRQPPPALPVTFRRPIAYPWFSRYLPSG